MKNGFFSDRWNYSSRSACLPRRSWAGSKDSNSTKSGESTDRPWGANLKDQNYSTTWGASTEMWKMLDNFWKIDVEEVDQYTSKLARWKVGNISQALWHQISRVSRNIIPKQHISLYTELKHEKFWALLWPDHYSSIIRRSEKLCLVHLRCSWRGSFPHCRLWVAIRWARRQLCVWARWPDVMKLDPNRKSPVRVDWGCHLPPFLLRI